MMTSRRLFILAVLILLFAAYIVPVDAGNKCKGASCDPLPPKAQACEHAAKNPHCTTPEPQPSPTMPPPYASPTPRLQATRMQPQPTATPYEYGDAQPWPTATPPYHKVPSIPFETGQLANESVRPCYPLTDLGPDDVALLIEAVAEGYSIIIVKDVLATSPDVIVIGND